MVTAPPKARYNRKQALANEPEWSHYQNAIFNWLQDGIGNLRIGAVAGSGKTTVLTGIVNRIPATDRVAVLAFNVHIVDTLKKRMPSRVTITTAHGMGYGVLMRHFQGEPVTVEESKYRKIARQYVQSVDLKNYDIPKKSEKEVKAKLSQFFNQLIRGCQSTLIEPTEENINHLINYYGIERPIAWQEVTPLVFMALADGEEMARDQRVIDFGDQLWLIHQWGLYPSIKDWLLIDECQDANPAQLSLYRKVIGDTGRAIAVGDEFQAIQGFAFASPEMWNNVATEFKAETLPLSVCYRCPSSHLDLARSLVPQIEARPDVIEGEISVVHPSDIATLVESGDLIICRFTAPIVSLCLKLITSGKQAKVRGRDIGSQLAALAERSCNGIPFSQFTQALNDYVLPEIESLKAKEELGQADALEDRSMAVRACYDAFGDRCSSLKQFCDRINSLFTDDVSPVILSTIHRAKGDEADRVFLLGCNSLPYTEKCTQDWQAQQERNLLYVALTRAKKSLFLVPLVRGKNADDALDLLLSEPYGGMAIAPVQYGTKVKAIGAVSFPAIGSRCKMRDPKSSKAKWTATVVSHYPGLNSVDVEWDELTPSGKHFNCYGKRYNDGGQHCKECEGWNGHNPVRYPIYLLDGVEA